MAKGKKASGSRYRVEIGYVSEWIGSVVLLVSRINGFLYSLKCIVMLSYWLNGVAMLKWLLYEVAFCNGGCSISALFSNNNF